MASAAAITFSGPGVLELWLEERQEKLNYDTINTDQASGRSHAGGTYKKGGKTFAGFAGRNKRTLHSETFSGCKKETGAFLQLCGQLSR